MQVGGTNRRAFIVALGRAAAWPVVAIVWLIITTGTAQAQGCTPNHELYRIVPEYRAVLLDGGVRPSRRRGQSLPKGSVVRHSKIGRPMSALGRYC